MMRDNRKRAFAAAAILLTLILLFSIGSLGNYLHEEWKSRSFSEELQEAVVHENGETEDDNTETGQDGQEEDSKQDIPPAEIDFEQLIGINSDTVAWIYCSDTDINYVIAQAQDNDYYLHRLLDKTEAEAGTLFMDYRNSGDLSDLNTVVYGHNMKSGAMFAALLEYQKQEFYDEHPVMYLYTPGERFCLELIAGYTTDINDRVYSIPATEEERAAILENACEKSTFRSDVKAEEGDRLVTLSTCSYAYDDARYVVIGRIVEE